MTAHDFIKQHFFNKLFLKFFALGIFNYGFSIGATYILTEIFKQNYFLGYVIAITLVTICNFFIATHYIFNTKNKYTTRFIKYALSLVFFYGLNLALVRFFVEILSIHYLIAITITIGMIFLMKFFVFDKLVFHRT